MGRTWNTFHIHGEGAEATMDEMLANDVRNSLQCRVEYAEWKETGKLEVGCEIYHKGWKQLNGRKFYYRDEEVVIGNDTFNVVALRSYNTIVGFRWMDKIYIVGKYSTTTSNQITAFQKKLNNPETIYYVRREV